MVGSEFNPVPMWRHDKEPNFSLELSIGHAVLSGVMSAQEGLDCLTAYERCFDSEPEPDLPEAA